MSTAVQAERTPEIKRKWEVATEKSRMDGKVTVTITKDSQDLVEKIIGTSRPYLGLKCTSGEEPQVFVRMGVQPEVEYGLFERHHVRLKFDDAKVESQIWGASTNNEALFCEATPKPLIRRMLASKILLFEFTEFQKGKHAISFQLDGMSTALSPYRKTCGL